MPDTALSVLVDALNRPVHFPKLDQAGSLFIAEPPTPFVSPNSKRRRAIGRSWRRRSS